MDLTRYHYYTDDEGKLHSVDLSTGEDAIESIPESTAVTIGNRFKYSKATAIAICNKVREGHSLASIANMPDMPSLATIYQWSRAIEEFSLQLDYAKEDRAHYYHDMVIKEASELEEASQVNVVKTKIDAYKWAAEKANRNYYGKDKQEAASGNISIIISTGIPDVSPVTVEAACKNVEQD